MENSRYRGFATVGLVFAGALLGLVGRVVLDWLIVSEPEWSSSIERVGGWVVGMVIVVVVLMPLLRIHGVFKHGERRSKNNNTSDIGQDKE